MKQPISQKEEQVLRYIEKYFAQNGFAPSVRDIARDLCIKSTATVFARVKKLTEAGYLKSAGSNLKRAMELSHKPSATHAPLVGTITAGQPILAYENIEGTYPIPTDLFGNGEMFLLHVKGDSMINDGIYDGDTIVVKMQATADNGEIVAAMIDDSATVKRFYKENGHFRLQPANDTMSPIICDDVKILGVVVGLMRKL